MKRLHKAAAAAVLITALTPAAADTGDYPEQGRGVAWGAVLGAVAAGPLGAIVGGAGGGIIGYGEAVEEDLKATRAALAEARAELARHREENRSLRTEVARREKDLAGQESREAALADCRDRNGDLTRLTRDLTVGYVFRTGSARLEPRQAEQVARIGRAAAGVAGLQVEIAGFADSRGAGPANEALSRRRAEAVAEVLAGHGLARERIALAAHGEGRALARPEDPEGLFFDRRVLVTFDLPAAE